MVIGRHECRAARNTNLKQAIAIGLDEALTALEESFHDLTDEQLRAFPIDGRNCIAWGIMHTLQNLDEYTNLSRAGQPIFKHDDRWDLWGCSDERRPKPGDAFPSQTEMMEWLRSLRQLAECALERATQADLTAKPDEHWRGNLADMYMRTIYHTMAHVRQIWLLRGALRLTDGTSWPRQHWA